MDCLGAAIFGFILVTFTVSMPVSLNHKHLTSSSSESSESSQSSSEEITVPRTTAQPIELQSTRENLPRVNYETPPPVLEKTIHPAITEQMFQNYTIHLSHLY